MADQYLPKQCKRLVNFFNPVWRLQDNSPSEEYLIVSELLEKSIPVDVIGLQFHMYEPPADFYVNMLAGKHYSPQQIFRALDYYSALGLPFYITEITVPHENETPEADEFQAYILRNILRLFFSYPTVLATQLWNTVSSYREKNTAFCEHIFYEDRVEGRAAYKMLDDLLNKEWRTNEVFTTDTSGNICCNAFYGEYTITVEQEGKTTDHAVLFNKNTAANIVITL
jgi:GH35 family endo-1,4-beta-xylanase